MQRYLVAAIGLLIWATGCLGQEPAGSHAAPGPAPEVGRIHAATASNSTSGSSASLTVRVRGLQPKGAVLAAVFAQPDGFPNRKHAAHTISAPAINKTADLKLENVPPGNYAVAIFQDVNEDGVLNKSSFGMPSEPYGFSNNVRGTFGPPSFQAAAVKLDREGAHMEVFLK